MEQLALFSQDQEIKSLLEELEITSCLSSRCRFLLDRFNELTGTEFRKGELFYKGTDTVVDIDEVHENAGFISSMNFRLNVAGVKTIREDGKVYLEYNDKRIFRPELVDKCPDVVKREFGIEI